MTTSGKSKAKADEGSQAREEPNSPLDKALVEKAIAGDREAQVTLAVLFEIGIERDKDFEQAKKWFQSAAKAGHGWAKLKLAEYFEKGKGTKVNSYAADVSRAEAAELGEGSYEDKIAAFHLANARKEDVVMLISDESQEAEMILETVNLSLCQSIHVKSIDNVFSEVAKLKKLGLVILDVATERGKGAGLFKAFKSVGFSVPILCLCTSEKEEALKKVRNESSIGFLHKPLGAAQLEAKLKEVFKTVFG